MNALITFFVFHCVGALPLSVRRAIGAILGFLVSTYPSREKSIALLQMKGAGFSTRVNNLVRNVFIHCSQAILESINVEPFFRLRIVEMSEESRQALESIRSTKRAILALTAHLGNWDLLGAYFSRLGISVHTVGRSARNSLVHEILDGIRARCGIQTIWRDDSEGLRSIISIFRNGGTLAALIDQDTTVKSEMIPFFGVPVKTPSSLIELAKRYDATICVTFIFRNGDGYKISLKEVPNHYSVKDTLTFFNKELEEQIKKTPDQWVWFHKRWRTLSDGETLGTKKYIEALTSGAIFHTNQ